jgi:hypothetical protein
VKHHAAQHSVNTVKPTHRSDRCTWRCSMIVHQTAAACMTSTTLSIILYMTHWTRCRVVLRVLQAPTKQPACGVRGAPPAAGEQDAPGAQQLSELPAKCFIKDSYSCALVTSCIVDPDASAEAQGICRSIGDAEAGSLASFCGGTLSVDVAQPGRFH